MRILRVVDVESAVGRWALAVLLVADDLVSEVDVVLRMYELMLPIFHWRFATDGMDGSGVMMSCTLPAF